jgi:hypothetical protein
MARSKSSKSEHSSKSDSKSKIDIKSILSSLKDVENFSLEDIPDSRLRESGAKSRDDLDTQISKEQLVEAYQKALTVALNKLKAEMVAEFSKSIGAQPPVVKRGGKEEKKLTKEEKKEIKNARALKDLHGKAAHQYFCELNDLTPERASNTDGSYSLNDYKEVVREYFKTLTVDDLPPPSIKEDWPSSMINKVKTATTKKAISGKDELMAYIVAFKLQDQLPARGSGKKNGEYITKDFQDIVFPHFEKRNPKNTSSSSKSKKDEVPEVKEFKDKKTGLTLLQTNEKNSTTFFILSKKKVIGKYNKTTKTFSKITSSDRKMAGNLGYKYEEPNNAMTSKELETYAKKISKKVEEESSESGGSEEEEGSEESSESEGSEESSESEGSEEESESEGSEESEEKVVKKRKSK